MRPTASIVDSVCDRHARAIAGIQKLKIGTMNSESRVHQEIDAKYMKAMQPDQSSYWSNPVCGISNMKLYLQGCPPPPCFFDPYPGPGGKQSQYAVVALASEYAYNAVELSKYLKTAELGTTMHTLYDSDAIQKAEVITEWRFSVKKDPGTNLPMDLGTDDAVKKQIIDALNEWKDDSSGMPYEPTAESSSSGPSDVATAYFPPPLHNLPPVPVEMALAGRPLPFCHKDETRPIFPAWGSPPIKERYLPVSKEVIALVDKSIVDGKTYRQRFNELFASLNSRVDDYHSNKMFKELLHKSTNADVSLSEFDKKKYASIASNADSLLRDAENKGLRLTQVRVFHAAYRGQKGLFALYQAAENATVAGNEYARLKAEEEAAQAKAESLKNLVTNIKSYFQDNIMAKLSNLKSVEDVDSFPRLLKDELDTLIQEKKGDAMQEDLGPPYIDVVSDEGFPPLPSSNKYLDAQVDKEKNNLSRLVVNDDVKQWNTVHPEEGLQYMKKLTTLVMSVAERLQMAASGGIGPKAQSVAAKALPHVNASTVAKEVKGLFANDLTDLNSHFTNQHGPYTYARLTANIATKQNDKTQATNEPLVYFDKQILRSKQKQVTIVVNKIRILEDALVDLAGRTVLPNLMKTDNVDPAVLTISQYLLDSGYANHASELWNFLWTDEFKDKYGPLTKKTTFGSSEKKAKLPPDTSEPSMKMEKKAKANLPDT